MRIERLGSHHDVAAFECGNKALDDWLRAHAHENQRRNLSRTFVLVDDDGSVRGYYSLTMGGARRGDLPPGLGRGLPRYDIGIVLLARLAIDRAVQGQGYGRDLLVAAIRDAASAGQHAAARFIAVDPIDDAARSFYTRFGFIDIPGDVRGWMFIRLDDAIATLIDNE